MNFLKNISKSNKKELLRLILFVIFCAFLVFYIKDRGTNFYVILGFVFTYVAVGYEIFEDAFYSIRNKNGLDENVLMSIATFVAFLMGNYIEACVIVIFYSFGEIFEDIASETSKNNIKSLVDIVPNTATLVKKDGSFVEIDIRDIEVSDILIAKDGQKIAVDGVVVDGEGLLDTSSLTGESMPIAIKKGSNILSSTILTSGIIKYRANKVFDNSIANKIIKLIEESSKRKAESEKIIRRFAKIYTPFVVAIAAIIATIPPILGFGFKEYLLRAGTFLILACPCALVISIPLTYISGLSLASKNKILVKGSKFLEILVDSDVLLTDKTGTLTVGDFKIKEIKYYNDYSKNLILDYLYNLEKLSDHPIAKSIVRDLKRKDNPSYFVASKNINGMGIWAKTYENSEIRVGNEDFVGLEKNYDDKAVYMSINNNLVCKVIVEDRLKDDTLETINDIRDNFSQIAILSGDGENSVRKLAKKLEVGYCANLLPDEKLELLVNEQKNGHKVIFVGDGINDGPVLKRADVGISMGQSSSDLAIESSDILIVDGEVSKIKDLLEIARLVDKTAKENLVFIMFVKLFILILGFFGYAPMWLAIFGDVGLTIITILWAMRILNKKI